MLEESSLYIFTFGSTMLPEFIEVGYIKYRTRPYIPSSLRCFNCRFTLVIFLLTAIPLKNVQTAERMEEHGNEYGQLWEFQTFPGMGLAPSPVIRTDLLSHL